jgi:hypothetical protein
MPKQLSLAQEYQNLLYQLIETHVLSMDGQIITGNDGVPEQVFSREDVVDKLLIVLNEFGQSLNSDPRFKGDKNETESRTDGSLSGPAKKTE